MQRAKVEEKEQQIFHKILYKFPYYLLPPQIVISTDLRSGSSNSWHRLYTEAWRGIIYNLGVGSGLNNVFTIGNESRDNCFI